MEKIKIFSLLYFNKLQTAPQAISALQIALDRSSAIFRAVQHLVCREIPQNTHSLFTEALARRKNKARAHRNLCISRPVRVRAP
jgi:hypothetical protein